MCSTRTTPRAPRFSRCLFAAAIAQLVVAIIFIGIFAGVLAVASRRYVNYSQYYYRRALLSIAGPWYTPPNFEALGENGILLSAVDLVANLISLVCAAILVHDTRPLYSCRLCCCGCSCGCAPRSTRRYTRLAVANSAAVTLLLGSAILNLMAAGAWGWEWAAWETVFLRAAALAPPAVVVGLLGCGAAAAPSTAATAPEALRASHVRSGTAKTDADATAPSDVPIEVAKTDAEAPPVRVCCQRPRRCRKAAWAVALVELACVAVGVGLYWELYLRPECYCVEREWGADWSYPPGCRRPADAPEPLDEPTDGGDALELYASCDAVADRLRRAACPGWWSQGYYRRAPWNDDDGSMIGQPEIIEVEAVALSADGGGRPQARSPDRSAPASSPKAAAPAYSETNVQVEGVDEADVVKSDGNYMYVLHRRRAPPPPPGPSNSCDYADDGECDRFAEVCAADTDCSDCGDCADGVWGAGYNDQLSVLTIVKAWPAAAASAVATVELSAVYNVEGSDLMLDGDSLLVVGSAWYPEGGWRTEDGADGAALPTVALLTFDITDRAAPALVRRTEIEGHALAARKVGSRVFVVTESRLPATGGGGAAAVSGVLPVYRDATADAEWHGAAAAADGWAAVAAASPPFAPLGSCASIGYSAKVRPRTLITVSSLSLERDRSGEPLRSATVSGRGAAVYASASSLYVAAATAWRRWGQQTAVLRFALGDDGSVAFAGALAVPGFLLSQWALDEHVEPPADGGSEGRRTFRVVTTTRWGWWDEAEDGAVEEGNHLFTFDVPAGGAAAPGDRLVGGDGVAPPMVQLGSLTGLAPGESVYAVRFMGERLYVVTFLQVDPLFVIDLSDAAAPTLLGQLKIPGYSDYLHPLNASHLIGVGKDAEVTGRVLGLKLALFDASDVSNPREAFTTVVGARGTDSEALRDHKAFVYDDDRRLLVLPLTLYGEAGGVSDYYYDSPESPDAVCDERWAAGTHSADTRWAPDEVMLWRGAAVWRVGDAAFELRGAIAHYNASAAAADAEYCSENVDYYTGGAPACAAQWGTGVRRAVFVGDDVLYTVSNNVVRADNLSALAAAVGAVAALPLATVDLLGSGGACARACECVCASPCASLVAPIDALVARELAR